MKLVFLMYEPISSKFSTTDASKDLKSLLKLAMWCLQRQTTRRSCKVAKCMLGARVTQWWKVLEFGTTQPYRLYVVRFFSSYTHSPTFATESSPLHTEVGTEDSG